MRVRLKSTSIRTRKSKAGKPSDHEERKAHRYESTNLGRAPDRRHLRFAGGQHRPTVKADASKKEAKAPMFKHEYADVNGVRLHYVTAGKGKLIMFVHCFT